MLLRSSSTPILNSWLPHSKDSSPEPEFRVLQRTKSVSLAGSFHSHQSPIDDQAKKPFQAKACQRAKKSKPKLPTQSNKQQLKDGDNCDRKQEAEPDSRIQTLLTNSGLGERVAIDDVEEGCGLQTLVTGGGMGSGGRGGICGGDGGRGGSDGGDGDGGLWFHGRDGTDAYYQKMIEANPDNALLLGNYAKFLKEVRGDLAKAEEYAGRAILANPSDGNALSLYADIIWQSQRDAQRAESYFDQAVKTAPDDCYVLASYASFLWEAEDNGKQENETAVSRQKTDCTHESQPSFFRDSLHHPSIAAAS